MVLGLPDTQTATRVAVAVLVAGAFLLLHDTDYSVATATAQRKNLPKRPGLDEQAERKLNALRVVQVVLRAQVCAWPHG